MRITISRDTVGRGLGVLILLTLIGVVAYLATAWVWWELNPGAWSAPARAVCLVLAGIAFAVRMVEIEAPATSNEE